MTAVFTDAVPDLRIKIEPGLVTVKKEKVELGEIKQAGEEKNKDEVVGTSEQNDTPGELFSQLVGEVNKLNEKGEEKSKDLTKAEELTDAPESVDKTGEENANTSAENEKLKEVRDEDDSKIDTEVDDGLTLAISNVTTQLDEEETGVKSVTEVLDDISDTLEAVTKQIVSKQGEVKEKIVTESESETKEVGGESSKDLPNLPEGISVSLSPAKEPTQTNTDEASVEKKNSLNDNNVEDADGDGDSSKEDTTKKCDDKLFSDIDIGEDPWSNAFDKSKDADADSAIASGSWVPDDKGMEDLESAPGMEVRDLRQRSDFFYDEDYYNAGGEGDTGELVPGADDPLMEMDDDDTTGDNDDFGGYDPLKLVQMTGGELNNLDFEMEDFDEDITMEDHDIMEDKDDHTEDGVDHEKDDLSEEVREVSTEESKCDGKESEVIDRENDLDISDESGLSDSRDGLNKDFDQGGDELNEDNYNLDNDVDPPEKDSKTSNSKSKKSDKFSKSKNGGTVENTLDDSKEDDTVNLDASVSSEKVMGENSDFTDHLAGEENLNEDCDDDLKEDVKSDCNYQHQQEDHNFESVECSKTNNFDGTSDDKDCINDDIDHQSDEKSRSSVRKSVEDQHNVLSEDISTDNFENGPSTENVDDINDFNATDEADFEFQIEQVQSIQDSSQVQI